MEYFAVFMGGGVGSILRYAISKWLGSTEAGFPTGTLTANILSCIVLGLAWGYFAQRADISPSVKLMVLTGFCGGFSTFSTFSLETFRLFQMGSYVTGTVYVSLSIMTCILVLLLTLRIFE